MDISGAPAIIEFEANEGPGAISCTHDTPMIDALPVAMQ